MHNQTNKLIAVLLLIIVFFSSVITSGAFESTEGTTQAAESTAPDNTDITPPIEEPESTPETPEPDDNDIIGKIYLCSRWSSVTTTGHLWIYIHNTSSEPITVGLLEVQPDEGVSLATFGFTRSDGFGIYYNMETYRNDKYCDESCISISDDLTRDELAKVSKKLLNSNHWDPIFNCVFFACSIWNTAGNRFIMPFFYPPVTRAQIKSAGDGEICQMVYQPPENTYKQRGIGKNSYLDHLSQKSLDK